ncbi:hypothetical protein [Chitinibacter tainanensis]|uniref:hypothetical protein n=1 Tax=Chitinibacter tainanensis TaxID=230667 RepID=UPI0003F73162|nr:hypothetical protein [Chitinibacter tainanensis]
MNSVSDLATPIVDQQGTTLLDLARLLKAGDQQSGIELSDFKARTAHELRRFGEDLASHLSIHAHVQVPPAYQLRSTSAGGVMVVGDHPNKAAIEQYLNQDTRLLKWFKEIEVLFEIQRRLELDQGGEEMRGQVFNLGMTSIGSIAFFTNEA